MKKIIVALAAALAVAGASANEWVFVGSNVDGDHWSAMLPESLPINPEQGLVMRIIPSEGAMKRGASVQLFRVSTTRAECARGYGTAAFTALNGKPWIPSEPTQPFAFGAGNMASVAVEVVCYAAGIRQMKVPSSTRPDPTNRNHL